MDRFKRRNREEWVQKSQDMEKECTRRIKEVATSFIRDPRQIAEALQFGSRFYSYSVRNTQLMYSQNPHATYVQSFPAWKKLGYSVKRGETGMKIFVPVQVTLLSIDGNVVRLSDATKQQQEDYHKGKIEGHMVTRFKLGTVFDIAQTTFPPEKYPELYSVGYPSELHEDICKGLMDYARDEVHCNVKSEDLHAITLRGFFNLSTNEIVVNSSLQGTQKLSTFAHELGHAIIHNSPSSKSVSRKELEADALDIMIESGFGLELTDARKDHLASHYYRFEEELKEALGSDISEEKLMEGMDDVLSSVYGTYNDIIDSINLHVEKYVPLERLKDMTKDLEVDVEESFLQKGIDKEISQESRSVDLDFDELER